MTIFELLRAILFDQYELVPGSEAKRNQAIEAQMTALALAFNDLKDEDRAPPDYQDAATRFAYVRKYTACHADIVAEKIRSIPALGELFERGGWIEVACVGGGPGSDFLGIVKHMIRTGATTSLKCFLLDREPAWGDTWAGVEQHTEDLTFRISTHCQTIDVTDAASWQVQKRYLRADLFTFIYFISEVWRLRDDAEEFFVNLFESAKPGSLFLFVDNKEQDFYSWFDGMANGGGLGLLARGEEKFQISPAEEKTDLEPFYSRFSHSPKLQTWIAWRVYRKPIDV